MEREGATHIRQKDFQQLIHGFSFAEHISGLGDYVQASVLIPLVLKDDVYHIVFEQRTPHIRQGGEICFPGGKMDPTDASPMETAMRETWEEIGCKREDIRVIGRLGSQLMASGSLVHVYLGALAQPMETLTPAAEEVAAIFSLPLSFFLENPPETYACQVLVHPYRIDSETGEKQVLLPVEELGLPACYSEPWGNAHHNIYVYRTEYGLVWGLTAKIIYECAQTIQRIQQEADAR